MPLALIMTVAALLLGCGAQAVPLTGTWRASGTLMTTSMVKTGEFRLRIRADGRYALVSAPGTEFVIDGGRFSALSRSAYVRLTATGAEERGTVERRGDGWRLAGTYGRLELRPADADAAQDAALDRVASVFGMEGLRSVSAWTSRAMQLALLWRPDARLVSVSATDFDTSGVLQTGSNLSMLFLSPGTNRTLLLAPARIELPAFFANEAPRQASTPSLAIPVPIRDLQELVRAARAGGYTGRLTNARLRVYEDRARGAKLLWIADVPGTFQRWCLAVITGEAVDCRQWAGDPEAEFAELARRAAAGWRALQQRWSAASSTTTFEPQAPSEFDRCGNMGGRYEGGNCFDYYGKRIYP